ncbi:transforming growth factor beta receptor type 3-like [Ylistrum balloti]|uniref:transforming growth factor beta receptor type 3-like n=1 Tax=Ylistrum balloti TaxID=509963 RepID=UPI0029059368|nr:transforming growth factor beta receptor type 3-like [Ylistrum balloti]
MCSSYEEELVPSPEPTFSMPYTYLRFGTTIPLHLPPVQKMSDHYTGGQDNWGKMSTSDLCLGFSLSVDTAGSVASKGFIQVDYQLCTDGAAGPHTSGNHTQDHTSGDHTQDHTSGDHTQPHTSGNHTQPHTSGNHTQDHTSGDHTQDHTSGDHTQPHTSGNHTQDHTSGDHTQDHTSGNHTQDHTSGDHTQDYTSGDHTQPHTSGNHTQDHTSGDHTQDHTSGYHTQPHTSGYLTQPHTSGNHTQDHTSGNHTQDHTSGDHTQPHTSGNHTQDHTSGDHTQDHTSGYHTQPHTSGYHTQPHTSGNHTQDHTSGNHTQDHTSGDHTQDHTSGNHTQSHTSGYHTQDHTSGDHTQPHTSGYHTQPHTSGYHTQPHTSGYHTQDHTSGDNTNPSCVITYPYTTPHISAYYEQLTSGEGCSTNSTTESNQEVHVINLLNAGPMYRNDVAEVNLLIKSRNHEVMWKPVIFVLNSHQSVKWKVKIEMLAPPRQRQVFVVPVDSSVRLVFKSHMRRSIRKVINMPQTRKELLDWVKAEHHAITSFTELRKGNRIELTVGPGPNSSPVCEIRDDQPLNAVARIEQLQLLSGCSSRGHIDSQSSLTYVIELEKAYEGNPRGKPIEVELDIKSPSRKTAKYNLLLVLKSPRSVIWKIQTKRIQGNLDIVSNAEVSMLGIKVDNAGTRLETITYKREGLIQWVNYHNGPVSLYAGISLANKVTIVLPQTDESESEKEPENPSKIITPPFDNIPHTKRVFNRAIHAECHPERHMIVAFSKLIQQNFGLEIDQLTLRDPACKAGTNETHVILGLSPSNCGTQATVTDGNTFYNNVLLVHRSSADGLEEVGSGYDALSDNEISGSGSHDPKSETYFDDEDFQRDAIRIEVMCQFIEHEGISDSQLTTQTDTSWTQSNRSFSIKLYRSSVMKEPVYRFPMTVSPYSYIYVEVDMQPVEHLQVMIHSCWLSNHMDKQTDQTVTLIENGCRKPSVRWITNQSFLGASWGSNVYAQRFSFNTGDHFHAMFLQCRLGVCSRNTELAQGIPCGDEMCGKIDNNMSGKLIVRGPLEISGQKEPPEPSRKTIIKPPINQGVIPKAEQSKPRDSNIRHNSNHADTIVIEGLDSGTVVGIAFAAFIIGVLLMAALWFIHTHTGPIKHAVASRGGVLSGSGESTPMSTAPITINS